MATSWYVSTSPIGPHIFTASGAEKFVTDRQISLQQHDPIPGRTLYGPFDTLEEAQAFAATHPQTTLQGIVQSINPLPGSISQLTSQLGEYLTRIGEAVLGIVLIAIAANVILKSTTGVDAAASTKRGISAITKKRS